MSNANLASRIDAIESGYEYMLAYAAQGRTTDVGAGEQGIRHFLENMQSALEGLGELCLSEASLKYPNKLEQISIFLDTVDRDAGKALSIISLVLAQADISSQIIDNVNASIHLRALLTDLFIVDEAIA